MNKKNYMEPEMQILELKMGAMILAGSIDGGNPGQAGHGQNPPTSPEFLDFDEE